MRIYCKWSKKEKKRVQEKVQLGDLACYINSVQED